MAVSLFRGSPWARARSSCYLSNCLTCERIAPCGWLLRWQFAPGLDIDYAISVRLHDAGGGGVYQKDLALWEPGHPPTGSGGPSAQFDTLAQLDLPADLQPGEYELRLVVYDTETLKPTVELGVWEPKLTLARLRLAEVQ